MLIAFQSDRAGDQNLYLFDHLSATQVNLVLNDTTYPARDVIADFKKHRYVEYYKMFIEFARDYYWLDPLTVGNFVDNITYKEEFPVFYTLVQINVNTLKINGKKVIFTKSRHLVCLQCKTFAIEVFPLQN